VVAYVKENNVDCDLWVGDTLDVPVTPEAADKAKNTFERFKAAGGKVDHIKVTQDRQEAAEVVSHHLISCSITDSAAFSYLESKTHKPAMPGLRQLYTPGSSQHTSCVKI